MREAGTHFIPCSDPPSRCNKKITYNSPVTKKTPTDSSTHSPTHSTHNCNTITMTNKTHTRTRTKNKQPQTQHDFPTLPHKPTEGLQTAHTFNFTLTDATPRQHAKNTHFFPFTHSLSSSYRSKNKHTHPPPHRAPTPYFSILWEVVGNVCFRGLCDFGERG